MLDFQTLLQEFRGNQESDELDEIQSKFIELWATVEDT